VRVHDHRGDVLKHVDLTVRAGELVGVAGVGGNGLAELEDVASGLRRVSSGSILHDGQEITRLDARELRRRGLAYVPADRLHRGSSLTSSVMENMIIASHHRFLRGGVLRRRQAEGFASRLAERFSIEGDPRVPIGTLSGGNIQKVILARELSRRPRVLIAAQPTRGVDIGATEYIHERLLEQRDAGTAILLISEDLDEIQELSDTIAVMYEGQIVGTAIRGSASPEALGLLMAGVVPGETAPGPVPNATA
jgi:simple sugar transport system ATP-binding protein